MTAKETIAWMEEKGYLGMWIRPELRVNAAFSYYKTNPPGNRPEMMPMDNSLNQDIHEGVKAHIAATRHLKDDDERKFMGDTPKNLTESYLTVWSGCPTDKRIEQDVDRFVTACEAIVEKKGVRLDSFGRIQNGRRIEGCATYTNWGGWRPKGEAFLGGWWHPRAAAVKKERNAEICS